MYIYIKINNRNHVFVHIYLVIYISTVQHNLITLRTERDSYVTFQNSYINILSKNEKKVTELPTNNISLKKSY